MLRNILVFLICLYIFSSCVTTEKPIPPYTKNIHSKEERGRIYEENKIIKEGTLSRKYIVNRKKHYNPKNLDLLFRAPYTTQKTRIEWKKFENILFYTNFCATIGGGFIGYNIGNLTTGEKPYNELWIIGGVFTLAAFILDEIGDSYSKEAVASYNNDLKIFLNISKRSSFLNFNGIQNNGFENHYLLAVSYHHH